MEHKAKKRTSKFDPVLDPENSEISFPWSPENSDFDIDVDRCIDQLDTDYLVFNDPDQFDFRNGTF